MLKSASLRISLFYIPHCGEANRISEPNTEPSANERNRTMNETPIRNIVDTQRHFFYSGTTLNVDYRIQALKKLKAAILNHKKSCSHLL